MPSSPSEPCVSTDRRKHTLTPADPSWFKEAIFYELHVRAFHDSNGDGAGDFAGLTQKLDYLEDLGVTCIWLLPFYPSPLRDDGYDISDYTGIHETYGTLKDFRALLREAHRRGIRVVTELVLNHTSDQHPWFQVARNSPPGSKKRDLYVWSDTDQKYRDTRIIFLDSESSNWSWDPVAKAYFWHRFYHHQPDLNFDNPAVYRAVSRVLRFWLDLGVDGLRLDAVPYLIEREGTNCENLPETHSILKQLRRDLDARYSDRMFLAEANQWPEDVRPYFGDGDECHMAFHFPLMPRIFMALRQEDRYPITEILRKTPDIPANCQWALFLRNHDELTLEMVTHEERDFMYGAYAADPRMRLNLGIRRRLAPLVDNSRRRLELLNSLLFSMPGTPVLYYGDEIGMGDNIFLGDRNGVRTPMQWSGDRNAGFSRADPARLYAPPIMDPLYGYQALNVEAQQRDPSSLLNFMKRIIALRKQHPIFGRGSLEFLQPKNRKILAYVRRDGGQTVLCVANLSRFMQPAELDLSAFRGLSPVEMFGRTPFPPIGDLPYFLTLGPHGFCWFLLEKAPAPITIRGVPLRAEEIEEVRALPVLAVGERWDLLFSGPAAAILEKEILPRFLPRQRWFGGKARTLRSVEILDWGALNSGTPPSFLLLLRTTYEDGAQDVYFVPLGIATGPGADRMARSQPGAIVARVKSRAGDGVLHDALADDDACAALLAAIERKKEIRLRKGSARAEPTSAFGDLRGPARGGLRVVRGALEQSNTSVRFADRLILKVFRRIEPGTNPDLEIGRFLTEANRFAHVPRAAGGIEYVSDGGEPATLALLQGLVAHQGSAWDRAVDEMGRSYERVSSNPDPPPEIDAPGLTLFDLAEVEAPAAFAEVGGLYLQSAATLGARTGEMHRALGSGEGGAFGLEPFSPEDLRDLAAGMRAHAEEVLATLKRSLDGLAEPARADARTLLESKERILGAFKGLATVKDPGARIRCHGDYHLGQVLCVGADFVILDFEGEPARSLAERRAKQSPLKDVAGMMRSFAYGAHVAFLEFEKRLPTAADRVRPWVGRWERWVGASFLRAYRGATAGAPFLPRRRGGFEALLRAFLLDKTLYEVRYELNNRPTWAHIPIRGLLALAAPSASARTTA